MHRRHWFVMGLVVLVGMAGCVAPTPPGGSSTSSTTTTTLPGNDPGSYQRLLGSGGVEPDGSVGSPSISDDGRFLVFTSAATNLVGGDHNGIDDVFLWDRHEDDLVRIQGAAEPDGASAVPVISGNGRYVAFASTATNLVPGDTNGYLDVFVWDRTSGSIERIPNGVEWHGPEVGYVPVESNGLSAVEDISDDGQVVLFVSLATNLVDPPTFSGGLYVWRRGQEAVSAQLLGLNGEFPNGRLGSARLSGDGSVVTFSSESTNLADGVTEPDQLYAWTIGGGVEALHAPGGELPDTAVGPYGSSDDGRFVVFESQATNLVPGREGDVYDTGSVFVWDRVTGSIEVQPPTTSGAPAPGHSFRDGVSISDDGRAVGVNRASDAPLVAGGELLSAHVWDRSTGAYTMQPAPATPGACGPREPWGGTISGDGGSVVVIASCALTAGKTTESTDLFVWDRSPAD